MSDQKPIPITAGYVGLLPILVKAARQQGYALGLHGSLNRDLDLIAVPWVEDARSAEELVQALAEALAITRLHRIRGPYLDKPHRRLCWNLHLDYGAYIDLSVFLREQDSVPQPPELPHVLTFKQRHQLGWQFYKATVHLNVDEQDLDSRRAVAAELESLNVPTLASQLSAAERNFLQRPDNIQFAYDD